MQESIKKHSRPRIIDGEKFEPSFTKSTLRKLFSEVGLPKLYIEYLITSGFPADLADFILDHYEKEKEARRYEIL